METANQKYTNRVAAATRFFDAVEEKIFCAMSGMAYGSFTVPKTMNDLPCNVRDEQVYRRR